MPRKVREQLFLAEEHSGVVVFYGPTELYTEETSVYLVLEMFGGYVAFR